MQHWKEEGPCGTCTGHPDRAAARDRSNVNTMASLLYSLLCLLALVPAPTMSLVVVSPRQPGSTIKDYTYTHVPAAFGPKARHHDFPTAFFAT